ncbi:DUF2232 domain-containing protein [Ghiorsea bivora]|uniref:DUF2232 domain-containing protein n=1 Tax=Ghiorsea bivora TaxID=1485545 RepID=UPI00056E1FE2|nr:DUF2232 domain-containing protein [Ghiorsea bivora]
MNQGTEQKPVALPKLADFFLTNRVPCAAMVVVMLTAAYGFSVLFGNLPIIGFLMLMVGMLLHLAVPSVFALILFGGGLFYSLQVGAIASALILFLSSGNMYVTLLFFVVFAVTPALTAKTMQREGLGQAAWVLAIVLFTVVILTLMIAMDTTGIQAFVSELFKPMFDDMMKSAPVSETQALDAIRQLQSWVVKIFPGLLVFSLWFVWWGNIVYARKTAKRYGFYQGNENGMLDFALPTLLIYVWIAFAAMAWLATGDLQYIAMNGLLVLSGLVAVQGVMVAHAWFESRNMVNTIIVMYVMLFFWSAVIILFIVVGLLDFWFNFRRNMVSTTGEK